MHGVSASFDADMIWFSSKVAIPFDTFFGVFFHIVTTRGDRLKRLVFFLDLFSFVASVVVIRRKKFAFACAAW